MISVTDCIAGSRYKFEDKRIGVVTPTYFWGLPCIVRGFLGKAEFVTDYLYLVATYGTTTGAVRPYAEKAMGRKFDSAFSVRMADNYTPMFDISTPGKLAKFTSHTEEEAARVVACVLECRKGIKNKPVLPMFLVKCTAQVLFNGSARKTSNFYVRENCVGCAKCAAKCPVQAIKMKDGRPEWVKDKCELCLGCLHRCPVFAIHYGNGATEKHGQYTNPNVDI